MTRLEALMNLEAGIADGTMAVKLAQLTAENMLSGTFRGEGSHAILELTRWEAEVLQFAIDEARTRIGDLAAEFSDAMERAV